MKSFTSIALAAVFTLSGCFASAEDEDEDGRDGVASCHIDCDDEVTSCKSDCNGDACIVACDTDHDTCVSACK